jgi:hypothetical protein
MERNDIQLEKEKEKTERTKKSKLTEKIEEYKTSSLSRIDELSADMSYQVYHHNSVNSTPTNIRRTGKDRRGEVIKRVRGNESNLQA